jgi:hypothetical protein
MEKFINKEWKEIFRQRVEIYARCMGYYANVSLFNWWKKAEFFGRKNFDIIKSNNSEFVKQYS